MPTARRHFPSPRPRPSGPLALIISIIGMLLIQGCMAGNLLCRAADNRGYGKEDGVQYIATPIPTRRITPYRTPEGRTIGRDPNGAGFQSQLKSALSRLSQPSQLSSSSPLVRLGPERAYTEMVREWTPHDTIQSLDPQFRPQIDGDNSFAAQEVGTVARAPMAFFEHEGELVVSAITRNGMNQTPIWTYSPEEGVRQTSVLPESAESGHMGYSFGNGLHLTPESWSGPVDYTAASPEGPWEKHDYTHLCPHDYKNLKWGFSYQCPTTGREFIGFGNADHPGMVITKGSEDWELFAAPDDMRFPTGVGVVTGGDNDGATLVSSVTYGHGVVHAIRPDGSTEKLMEFPSGAVVRPDHNARVMYVSTGQGRVYWADFDDLNDWREVKYMKPSGPVDHVEPLTEPNLHPATGTMLFPGMGKDGTALYEARREGEDIVLHEVLWLEGVGQWSIKTATVGDDFYLGTAAMNGQAADRAPGVIYRVDLAPDSDS